MKVVINPRVGRGESYGRLRKTRRLIYMALIADDLGHDVAFHLAGDKSTLASLSGSGERYDFTDLAKHLPRIQAVKPGNCDLYLCSSNTAWKGTASLPTHCPVVTFKEILEHKHDPTFVDHVALIVSYVWRVADFTVTAHREADPPGYPGRVKDKILSVPWRAHDRVTDQIHKDGLTWAYLRDELEVLRERYGAIAKKRCVGFVGGALKVRSQIVGNYKDDGRFVRRWAGGHHPTLTPAEYLLWLSECRIVLGLPGDTWKCSRFCESIIMGVPVVQQAGRIDITPPITRENAVLIDDWADKEAILSRLPNVESIIANANAAYREGWSLRGLFKQILKRLEL